MRKMNVKSETVRMSSAYARSTIQIVNVKARFLSLASLNANVARVIGKTHSPWCVALSAKLTSLASVNWRMETIQCAMCTGVSVEAVTDAITLVTVNLSVAASTHTAGPRETTTELVIMVNAFYEFYLIINVLIMTRPIGTCTCPYEIDPITDRCEFQIDSLFKWRYYHSWQAEKILLATVIIVPIVFYYCVLQNYRKARSTFVALNGPGPVGLDKLQPSTVHSIADHKQQVYSDQMEPIGQLGKTGFNKALRPKQNKDQFKYQRFVWLAV